MKALRRNIPARRRPDGTVFCGRQPTGGAAQLLSQVAASCYHQQRVSSADEVAAHRASSATSQPVITSAQSAAHLLAGQLALRSSSSAPRRWANVAAAAQIASGTTL